MKDFKSYTEGDGNSFEKDKGVNFVKSVAQSMNGKSEGEIMRAVIAQAENGKRDGTLTNADLDNFYAAVAPTLDGFKRKKLKEIIARLKKI
ncbi:MAG: hypothetical protein LUI60_01740 [Clostridia bacterium]|nr:hypothetical protein [Clostridia bacterium]